MDLRRKVVAVVLGLWLPLLVLADTRSPLLLPGKTTLYQRVLTRPGAELTAAPAGTVRRMLPPLTPLFVYERRRLGEYEWLEVGPNSRGDTAGWVSAAAAIDWKQALTVAFTNPAGRGRSVLFAERAPLADLLLADDGPAQAAALLQATLTGQPPPAVVAVEPATHIDLQQNFYLLPILDHVELDDAYYTKLLNVAAVNADTAPVTAAADFRVGVAFVIDTTISMRPYIEQTRAVVRQVCAQAADSPWRGQYGFALLAFRDSLKDYPAQDYTVRRYADFTGQQDCTTLLGQLAQVEEARSSNHDFAEDAFAGVHAALNQLDWTPYAARYIVLITDASARPGHDPLAATRQSAAELNLRAADAGIAILTLHLLTPAGAADHPQAAAQYGQLSRWRNSTPLYYGVPAGDVGAFTEAVTALVQTLLEQTLQTAQKSAGAAPVLDKLDLDSVGQAMRLAYLGRVEGARAPEMFSAWLAERDLTDPRRKALDVRVLLSKDQLSGLQEALRRILRAGDSTELAPQDFFAQVRGLLGATLRDPAAAAAARTLGDSRLLGEYLDGLPYRSALADIDEATWLGMGAGRRQEILDRIEARIELYQDWHDDVDLWITLDGDRSKGDALYPVPLDALP